MSRFLPLVGTLVVLGTWCEFAHAQRLQRMLDEEASRAKIERELDSPTELEFVDAPLSDAIDYLKERHQIEIQLDVKGLTDAAVAPLDPIVTKSLKGISLRNALRLILAELDLTYAYCDEVLLITSKEKADEMLLTQVYRVSDIVGADGERQTMSQLIDLIIDTIKIDSWQEEGGPGSIKNFRGLLVISQTFGVHEQISELLTQLRLALPKEQSENVKDRAEQPALEERDEGRIVIYELQHLNPNDAKQAIVALVMPKSWQEQGGTGSAFGVAVEATASKNETSQSVDQARRLLAVRQSDEVHQQIRTLLRRLDRSATPPNAGIYSGILPVGHGDAANPAAPPDAVPAP